MGLDDAQRLNCGQSRVGARNRLIFDKKILKRSKLWSLVAPRPGRVRESAEFYIQPKVNPCLYDICPKYRLEPPLERERGTWSQNPQKKHGSSALFRNTLCLDFSFFRSPQTLVALAVALRCHRRHPSSPGRCFGHVVLKVFFFYRLNSM